LTPTCKPAESTRALAPEVCFSHCSFENRPFSAACKAPRSSFNAYGTIKVVPLQNIDLFRGSIILCVRFSTACSRLPADLFDAALNDSFNEFNDANQLHQDECFVRRFSPRPPGSLSNIEHSCPAMNIGTCLHRPNRDLTLCPSRRKPYRFGTPIAAAKRGNPCPVFRDPR
jgi:hypothetical protein